MSDFRRGAFAGLGAPNGPPPKARSRYIYTYAVNRATQSDFPAALLLVRELPLPRLSRERVLS
jgi:hypothetical protein